MLLRARIALLAFVAVAGCAGAGAGVTVQKYTDAPPKPPGCAPEIIRNKQPSRPYQALGELTTHVTNPPVQGAVSLVLPKACELGADAVIVQRDMVLNVYGHVLVDVTAIRWVTPMLEPEPAASTAAPEPQAVPTTAAKAEAAAPSAPVEPPRVQSVPQSGAGSLNPREPTR